MKKFTYLAATLLVMAGAVSCKKNADVKNPEKQEPQGKMIPFSVTAGQSKEKTSMVNKVLSWTEGDVINVMTQDGQYPTSLTLSGGAGTATGSFEGEISENVEDGTTLCGMYKVNYSNGAYTVNIPATQEYTEDSFQEGLFPSIGTGTYVKAGKTIINFSTNPLSILRVTVKGASDEILTKVSIKSNNADIKLAGDFTLEQGTWAVSGGTEDEIVMTCPNLQLSADGVQLNFVVPPATFASGDLKVVSTITKAGVAGKLYTETNSSEITIAANNVSKIERSVVFVKDVQGNLYDVCKIGDQIWMAENMRCTKYPSAVQSGAELVELTNMTSLTPPYTPYYVNPVSIADKPDWMTDEQWGKVGLLYNWNAAVGVVDDNGHSEDGLTDKERQGICPDGWHIPARTELSALVDYVEQHDNKGSYTANKYLRTVAGWKNYQGSDETNTKSNDAYGFSILASGFIQPGGQHTVGEPPVLTNPGSMSSILTSTPNSTAVWYRQVFGGVPGMSDSSRMKFHGDCVRCIKNQE